MSRKIPSRDESSEPDSGALALKIAHVMEQRGDLRGAKEAYRFALSELSSSARPADEMSSAAEAALGQGRVAEGMGDLTEARQAFLRAAEIAQDNPTVAGGAWLGVAGLAQRMGDLTEARQAFLRAAEIAQDNPTEAAGAWLGVATIAERMGDLTEARQAYQKVIEISPQDQAPLVWLSMQRLRQVLEILGYPAAQDEAFQSSRVAAWLDSSQSDTARLHDQVNALWREAHRLTERAQNDHRPAWAIVWHPRERARGRPFELRIWDNEIRALRNRFVHNQDPILSPDIFALTLDQATLAGDLRNAVIKILAADQPMVLAVIFTEMIGRQSRVDVQNAAKMVRSSKISDDEITTLMTELGRLAELGLIQRHPAPSDERGGEK